MDNVRLQDEPVVKLLQEIVQGAIKKNASDIHFESTQSLLRVRYRIDGMLYDQNPVTTDNKQRLLSHLKVLAHINIAEKRVPQDGKYHLVFEGRSIDVRVSTFPAVYGEKIVARILDATQYTLTLDDVGMQDAVLAAFRSLVHRPHGFFLVTGPTGSGKTTTLYAALCELNQPSKNIITLEDPVEYNISGITQGHINPQAGFTFEKGMRALLRQDPDIVMVGEIRDAQTACIAIQAALTGHLVLSTLHTNDAPSVIMRLVDMGVEPFLINAAVSGILAQRLMRTICQSCKITYEPTPCERIQLQKMKVNMPQLYRGAGCDACDNIGYKGRTGIFELLEITDAMRELVMQRALPHVLYAQALQDGMQTLLCDGIQKVVEGRITLQDLVHGIGLTF
jgi:type II secretory ATPase GspE/PulE/Tfp pilus assembly ATPase PilB-like protein